MRICYGLVGMTRGHAARAIPEPSTNQDQGSDTSGRIKTVELIEALHQTRVTPA